MARPVSTRSTESPQAARAQQLVHAVGSVIRSIGQAPADLTPVLEEIAARAVGLSRAEWGYIFLREGDAFRLAGAYGGTPEQRAYELEHPTEIGRDSIVGRVALEDSVVQIRDIREDPEYTWPAREFGGFRTLLGVPIRGEDGLIGAFTLARNVVAEFAAEDIDLVSLFAGQAAVAIQVAALAVENVRLLQTVERQRTELARFAPQVASLLSSDEGEQLLAGHRREISALFCDLRGFTAFAEMAEPEEVLGVLREYHSAVGELAVAAGGTVEHFAGDGLMIFFNDPTPVPEHPLVAVRTALAMRERFEDLSRGWMRRGYELGLGIGVAVGYATLGRIGFPGRYDYGGVGNVVILASRLSGAAEPGQILVSQRAYAATEDRLEADAVEPMPLKGYSRPVPAYAVRGLHNG